VPEQRAIEQQVAYVQHMASVYQDLLTMVTNDTQKAMIVEEMTRYKLGYVNHIRSLFAAKSRCMSAMITGPSNFPTRSNQKRYDTENRRREEFLEYDIRAQVAMRKHILDARTVDEVYDDQWSVLKKSIDRDLAVVDGIDRGTEPYNRSAFTNSVSGKLTRMASNGQKALVRRALEYITEWQKTAKKPFFAARNSVWQLVPTVEVVETLPIKTGEELISDSEGRQIIMNHDIDRIQIFFNGKPSTNVVTDLKSAGWHWSPSNGAWQRKITGNALYSAKQIVGK
jgi:hypothetical protein